MRVLLKDTLDCDPDTAWRAIRSPAVLREVSSPVFSMTSLSADGFPTIWGPGDHPISLRGLGLVPLGTQIIRLNVEERRETDASGNDVRILRDTGRPLTGPLASVTLWDHRMAISAVPGHPDKTLYRDQLKFDAGALTLPMWPAFWSFWQWRMRQLKHLAPGWRFDIGVDAPADTSPTDTMAADTTPTNTGTPAGDSRDTAPPSVAP